ncbi:DUF1161 domain-containing protein [Sodalis sp. dw_96]|uniref:DUF1161 domain-containing protein n=1 Tax=Sodalis sp. dw_96 TaxID=2719794 RepID=UPI001BD3DB5E|nr:DUF1161 domain-containing protein [Sodalis sp. dw_96]
MKTLSMLGTLLALVLPVVAQASCESVKADITQKIVANGVHETSFHLDIVPNDQADRAGGQVVGHCDDDTQKIVYLRTGADTNSAPSP